MKSNFQKLNNRLTSIGLKVAQAKGVKERIDTQKATLREKIDANAKDAKTKKESHLLLLAFISDRREHAIKSLEDTGTLGIQAIYEDDRRLVFLRNEEKKNSSAFKMEVGIESTLNGKSILTGLKDERGGGLNEGAAWSLRMAALECVEYKGPYIIDEAYSSMSQDGKIQNVAKLLRKYVDTTGRQVIFSTHMLGVFGEVADNIIYVTQDDGVSSVEYIKE